MTSSSSVSPDLRLYEKLMMLFPGYRGYKEKELIRETDRIVREELYRRLKRCVNWLRNYYSSTVSSTGSTPLTDRLEKLIYRIDSLAEKTRHSPYGYKPLFHVVKVDEEVLNKVLEHDLKLGEIAEALEKAALNPPPSITEADPFLANIDRLAKEYEAMLEERENLLSGARR